MEAPVRIWTLDWVPEGPRGFVRDLRLRWACEEANIPYEIRTIAFDERKTNHLDRQPFGQVPMLEDGDIVMFESGACLIHLARRSETLMPRDPRGEAETNQWIFAALNSIEMVSLPWWFLTISGDPDNALCDWLDSRLAHLERVLGEREWLVGHRFSAADLIMADVLRVQKVRSRGVRPATEAYVTRATKRPAFIKAHADQLAHYALAEKNRKEACDAKPAR